MAVTFQQVLMLAWTAAESIQPRHEHRCHPALISPKPLTLSKAGKCCVAREMRLRIPIQQPATN